MVPRRLALLISGLALLASTGGCTNRPTYPKARIAGAVQSLLADEHFEGSAKLLDHTLAVQLVRPGTLAQQEGQISVGPAFDETVHTTLTVIHRVLLSTDAQVEFYVVLLSDPQVPGAYLTIVRYMDDVRRANANMLDIPEMFARTILELNFVGPRQVTIEQYVPGDIKLHDFLSWQLARRIQHKLTEELQDPGTALVGRCGGKFLDRGFEFTLDVAPAVQGSLDEAMIERAFQSATSEIAKVLSSYQFHSFDTVRLIHPSTGRNLTLPKSSLQILH